MDWVALGLSFRLGVFTVVLLLPVGIFCGRLLAYRDFRGKGLAEAAVALPLILPPTVLGFYLLILLGPATPIGALWVQATGSTLTFSFSGLVIASVVYSLPFTVQPLQTAFEAVGREPLEAAATLRASPIDAFLTVASPLAKRGYLTAAVLSFAHTVGEFGVVLMVGGNIPGETKVISIAIYEHVETLDYTQAHVLSAGLLLFSFAVLLALSLLNRRSPLRAG